VQDSPATIVADALDAYRSDLDPSQRSGLLAWFAFTSTFAGVRAITYSIRAGVGPFRNISAGGEHLHHYMWGIAELAGLGAVAVYGDDRHRRHPLVALAYGSGMALIVDEFALLLDLKDVYWAKQGRVSVDLAIGGSALAGTLLAAQPVLEAMLRKRRARRAARAGQPEPVSVAPVR
jgi:phytoene/squalene synthetase